MTEKYQSPPKDTNIQEEKLRQEILGDAKSRAERTIARAQNEADKTIEQAATDAERKRRERMSEAEDEARAQSHSIMLEVTRESRRHELLERERCLDDMFARALAAAAAEPEPGHSKSMSLLAAEAIKAMGAEQMKVTFPVSDSGLVTESWLLGIASGVLGEASGVSFVLEPLDDAAAGIVFTTLDGRKTFDNTYASRLAKMKNILRITAAN